MDADVIVIVVGAGLAGLIAAGELVERDNGVLAGEQEDAANLGVRRFGLLAGCSSRQSRTAPGGHPHTHELALQYWLGTAGFDRATSTSGRKVRWRTT